MFAMELAKFPPPKPARATEAGDHERVRDAERGADEAGHRDEPEGLGSTQVEAGRRELDDDDRPQLPHDETEELGEDRPAQVSARDRPAFALPLPGVFGIPVLDPAALADVESERGCLGLRGDGIGGAWFVAHGILLAGTGFWHAVNARKRAFRIAARGVNRL
jgi:hypothetical protein